MGCSLGDCSTCWFAKALIAEVDEGFSQAQPQNSLTLTETTASSRLGWAGLQHPQAHMRTGPDDGPDSAMQRLILGEDHTRLDHSAYQHM